MAGSPPEATVFLKDLFRYRTRHQTDDAKRVSKEEFLSSSLVELMHRDTDCCHAVLHTIGLAPPKNLAQRRVRTQVRLRDDELLGIPDIVVETPTWTGVIECKAGTQPELEQLARYAALAPKATIGFLWSDVPTSTWEDLVNALRAVPETKGNPLVA